MKNSPLRTTAIAVACLLFLGWLAILIFKPAAQPDPVKTERRAAEEKRQITTSKNVTVLTDTPFDREYGSENGTQEQDLEILEETLSAARILIKDHQNTPLADNRDFTGFLSGRNSHGVAWVRPDHPDINQDGEIVDRFGNPVFFHQESSSHTTIRSAGPDGQMWNSDDIISESANEDLNSSGNGSTGGH